MLFSSAIAANVIRRFKSAGRSCSKTDGNHDHYAADREDLYESVGKSLPIGRVGEPHGIAQAYLFLMQEGFGTGQTVVVDGGTVLVWSPFSATNRHSADLRE